jgi:putative DNA primase/helicase
LPGDEEKNMQENNEYKVPEFSEPMEAPVDCQMIDETLETLLADVTANPENNEVITLGALTPAAVAVQEAFKEQTVGAFRVGADFLSFVDEDDQAFQITANHVSVSFICRDAGGNRWTFCLNWKTPDGKNRWKLIPVPRLVSDWPALLAELSNEGLFVQMNGVRQFRSYLSLACGSADLPKVRLVTEVGFFPLNPEQPEGAFGFMLPSGAILPEGATVEETRYLPPFDHPALAAYGSAGDGEEWKRQVARAERNVLVVFGAAAGLAATMLQVSGSENCGFHLHGLSSSGKTTACQVGMSVWGCAADPQATHKPTLFQTWAATNNGREVMAASCSGGPMFLDEIGSMPQGLALAIYPLLNGRGKTRMTEYGGMRPQHTWRVLVLSTGEISVFERVMQEPQRQAMMGELVRFPEIPTDNTPRDLSLTPEQAQELALDLKHLCAENYGTAGPEFIRSLMASFSTLSELRTALLEVIEDAYQYLCAALSARRPLLAPHKRALRHFALVLAVGRWAAESALPFSEESVNYAVVSVAQAWIDEFPILTEHDRLLDDLRSYIIDQKFNLVNTATSSESAMGGRVPTILLHDGKFHFSPDRFQQACGDMQYKKAAKVLENLGALHRHENEGHKVKMTMWPNVFRGQRYYAIVASKVFGADELADLVKVEPKASRVAQRPESRYQDEIETLEYLDEAPRF